MMSLKKYWWLFIIAAPVFALSLIALLFYYKVHISSYNGPTTIFEIKPGEGFARINARLGKQNLISSTKVFHRYSQLMRNMTKFKAGRFEVQTGSTTADIVDLLIKGKALTTSVTIPEGKNLFEIAAILKKANIIIDSKKFIALAKSETFAKRLGIDSHRLEGYLYPDTYKLTPKSKPKDVLKNMVSTFKGHTKNLPFDKAPLGLSRHQVIILASVVEKETGAGFERPIIAGVFLNRLKKRMRLQSDPTTIYGIFERYNGNLRKRHLLEKTPYNTYKIPGLPIGAISNPGMASIKAVLNPKKHHYLYFVSQNDGTHVFSKTYREHRAAVDKYQKNIKARRGKSWRDLKQ